MDDFTLAFFSTLPICVVAALTMVYQWSGETWKRRPGIPLWLGIFMLMATFFLLWWLERVAETDTNLVKTHGTAMTDGAKHVLTSLATAYARQAKFVELAVIPFAMALIGTSLVLKIEKESSGKLLRLERKKRLLQQVEEQLPRAEEAFHTAVRTNKRGTVRLKAKQRIKALQKKRSDLQHDIRELEEEFGLSDWYGLGG